MFSHCLHTFHQCCHPTHPPPKKTPFWKEWQPWMTLNCPPHAFLLTRAPGSMCWMRPLCRAPHHRLCRASEVALCSQISHLCLLSFVLSDTSWHLPSLLPRPGHCTSRGQGTWGVWLGKPKQVLEVKVSRVPQSTPKPSSSGTFLAFGGSGLCPTRKKISCKREEWFPNP